MNTKMNPLCLLRDILPVQYSLLQDSTWGKPQFNFLVTSYLKSYPSLSNKHREKEKQRNLLNVMEMQSVVWPVEYSEKNHIHIDKFSY